MSRRRPPSPRGDDDPTPPRGRARTDGPDAEEWDDEQDEEWDEPNYLVRRALVVGAIVVGIAVVAVVASLFVGGDDDDGAATSDQSRWDTLVVLTADEVRLLEPDSGDEIETFDSTIDLLDAQTLVAQDVLVTLTDDGAIALLDLNDGTSRRGRAGVDETLLVSADNPRVAMVGADSGGDVTIVDTERRNVFSVADAAGLTNPLIFMDDVRVNAAGTHVAVPVPNAFQSFVIDIVDETSEAFAGRVIAISDDLVVTEQPAGGESEIEFHELGGDRLASVDVPTPRASLLTDDGSLLVVASDGTVRTIDADGEIDDADPLVDEDDEPLDATDGFVARSRTRLVVESGGAGRVSVLDDAGSVIGSADGRVVATTTQASSCAVIGDGSSTDPSTVLDLDDGSVVVTLERGLPAATSVDGCTVALLGGAENLVTGGEVVTIDARSIAEVTPDGDGVVVLDGRDTELVRLSEQDDPIELADEPVVIRFGRRS